MAWQPSPGSPRSASPRRQYRDDAGGDAALRDKDERVFLEDVWVRDPCVVVVGELDARLVQPTRAPWPLPTSTSSPTRPLTVKGYLLFGTTDAPPHGVDPYSPYLASGFDMYASESLDGAWTGPYRVFSPPPGFWSDAQFWAPEVFRYGPAWFMAATFKCKGRGEGRAVQILRSVSGQPWGPFEPFAFRKPVTPPGWFSLDGHVFLGAETPYLVFCREFTEVGDGQIFAQKLTPALDAAVGAPMFLFSASEAPWTGNVSATSHATRFVTDGPFLWKSRATGELLMLWSSIGSGGRYMVGIARSATGLVTGPFVHDPEPLFEWDGGHCWLFRPHPGRAIVFSNGAAWNGEGVPPLVMALHAPNKCVADSRPRFVMLEEAVVGGKLTLSMVAPPYQ